MYIIDNKVRELVQQIEEATEITPQLDALLRDLVLRIEKNCAHPYVRALYESYDSVPSVFRQMPVDGQGYVLSFDPLTEEDAFVECWQIYGIVAGKSIVSPQMCNKTMRRVHRMVRDLSADTCRLTDKSTWSNIPRDDAGVPVISRGFLEAYHDECLAALRQIPRLYAHYALIRGTQKLWVTFDRIGVKLPRHEQSKALPLHVDQNPNIHDGFHTVQGVLALSDCPAERGTFVGVPGSRRYFAEYGRMAKNSGQYVELDLNDPIAEVIASNRQVFPLRKGDLISWDSRTTHANTDNVSSKTRMVAYIAAGLAREDDAQAVKARKMGFDSGLGSVRDAMLHGAEDAADMSGFDPRNAMMHASTRPRYRNPAALARVRSPEKLTLLGRLLYAQERYDEIEAGDDSHR